MQDGGTGAGAQHGGAGREANLIFVLPPNIYVAPPVGGTFWFQIFIQAPSPEVWRKTISGGEGGCWRGSGVACFWATSLEKIIGGVIAIISFRPGGSTALSTCIYGTSTSRSCQNRAQQSLGRGECASASRFPFGSSQNILWRGRNSMTFATGCPRLVRGATSIYPRPMNERMVLGRMVPS